MKKHSLILLAAIGIFFGAGLAVTAQAAPLCCPGGQHANCTISTSPCDISGSFTGIDMDVNVNTASTIKINLTGDLNITGSNVDLENKFAGANKSVIINGKAPASSNADGKNIDITGGSINYPSGGITIDLSVPNSSTGNGGTADLTGPAGSSTFPANSTLKIYTQGSNAAGGSPTRGGLVDATFSNNTLLSSLSLIKTGNTGVAKVDGGNVDITGGGGVGFSSSSNFISTSSSMRAGDVTITGTDYFKGGIHANSCEGFPGCGENGGSIDLTGVDKFYAPDCSSGSLEAKDGGQIKFTGPGLFDLPATATTGVGGSLQVTGSVVSNCDCLPSGGACWTQLNANNSTVDFTGTSCDETDPMAACPPSASIPAVINISSTNADGFYKAGAVINVTVKFSGAVSVSGTPTLELETGAVNRMASYTGGSGTDTITLKYTVQPGDTSDDLDYVNTGSLSGTIKDPTNTNNATLTLPAPGAVNSLGSNKDIVIDTKLPTVGVTASDKNGAAIPNGGSVATADAATINFSSIGGDAAPPSFYGVYSHVINWTTDGWVNTNQVDCGSSGLCWVKVSAASTSYSPDNGANWYNCSSNPACSIPAPVNPLSGSVQYEAIITDLALNAATSGPYSFSVPAGGSFDYSFVPSNVTLNQGSSGTSTINVTLSSGTTQAVNFSVTNISPAEPTITSSWPSGNSCSPNCSKSLSVATTGATPVGTYAITVTSTSAGLPNKSVTFNLTVNPSANTAPAASNLTVNYNNDCNFPAYTFRWRFTDPDGADKESKYEFQLSTDPTFATTVIDQVTTLSPLGNNGGFNALPYQLDPSSPPNPLGANKLAYGNVTYYWRVMVWDNHDMPSAWVNAASSFKTPDHRPPQIGFTPPTPSIFLVDSPVDFKTDPANAPNNSKCFTANNAPTACKKWEWDFNGDGTYDKTITNPPAANGNTTYIYTDKNTYNVTLKVTDPSGTSCSNPPGSKKLKALEPTWKEVVPRNY